MLDNLTEGRLDLGRGLRPPEFEAFGVDQQQSREMFLESFDIIRWLLDPANSALGSGQGLLRARFKNRLCFLPGERRGAGEYKPGDRAAARRLHDHAARGDRHQRPAFPACRMSPNPSTWTRK